MAPYWKIYYVKSGRRIESAVRYDSEAKARLAALDRGYYDGISWKIRKVES